MLRKSRIRGGRAAMPAVALATVLTAAACSGSGGSGGTSTSYSSDSSVTLTVWTDDTRQPAVQEYVATHPNAKVKVVLTSYGAGQVPEKIALSNRSGSGWPDVVFLGAPSDAAALAAAPISYAEPLNDLVPAATRAQYAAGTLANCTYNGKVYCLQNDVAPVVLWVNTKLMKQFGYTVPTTWAEYQALGEKLAAEHAGYLMGTINDRDGYGAFLGSSGCTDRQVADATHITINLADESCTRVAKLLQPLVDDGTITTTSPWDASFATNVGAKDKFLMYPAAAWFGEYGFKGTYKIPNGEIAAYPVPTWPGSTSPVTGAEGGGVWLVSAHSKNVKGAADIATWLTTSTDPKGIVNASALPAYAPAAKVWCAARASDAFYATDPCAVEQREAGLIASNFNFIRFEGQFDDSYATAFLAAAQKKGDLVAALSTWQGELVQAATNAGYQVAQ